MQFKKAVAFPTSVGVNRQRATRKETIDGFPHECGGEPIFPVPDFVLALAFPTSVGVNRWNDDVFKQTIELSPRVWG